MQEVRGIGFWRPRTAVGVSGRQERNPGRNGKQQSQVHTTTILLKVQPDKPARGLQLTRLAVNSVVRSPIARVNLMVSPDTLPSYLTSTAFPLNSICCVKETLSPSNLPFWIGLSPRGVVIVPVTVAPSALRFMVIVCAPLRPWTSAVHLPVMSAANAATVRPRTATRVIRVRFMLRNISLPRGGKRPFYKYLRRP